MNRRKCIATLGALALPLTSARAQPLSYPSRPITIVVPYPAGGVGDSIARIIGEKVAEKLRQPVVVDCKPGGNSVIGTQAMLRAPADGYTWLLAAPALLANPFIFKDARWQGRDFTPVGIAVSAPAAFAVPAELPVQNLADFVKLVRGAPGKYNYANPSTGSSMHLNSEMFKQVAGLDLVPVNYSGQPPALLGLLRADVAVMLPSFSLITQHVKSGRLRVLAVISREREPLLPDVPTLAEAGYPEANVVPWYGFAVSSATPAQTTRSINEAINDALADPGVQQCLRSAGFTPERPRNLGEIAGIARSDEQRYEQTVRRANLRAD